jgi:lysine 2,3-aminomutase
VTKAIKQENKTIKTTDELLKSGLIGSEQKKSVEAVSRKYATSITHQMHTLINKSDPNDPIALQFVPHANELKTTPNELTDPIGDANYSPVKGIVHRYKDRCLLKPVHVCPVYCRFCFRREQVGPGSEAMSREDLEKAYEYIASQKDIWEVILTGGDPFIMKPKFLLKIINRLVDIENVEIIRIHTRIPVTDPERITQEMVDVLKVKKPVYVVLHSNHSNEFNDSSEIACARLVDSGIPMLSQSVLLKGVNDNIETLSALMRTFIRNRIKPYYLHHGDYAFGTSHFRTSISDGQRILRELRGDYSGICQPSYILDIPGGRGKVPIGPNYLRKKENTEDYMVEDPYGNFHEYTCNG